MKTDKKKLEPEFCSPFDHDWAEEYCGYTCKKCGMFIPDGCEPWAPIDDYDLGEYDYWGDEDED
jgi:hypothetical protein